MYIAIAISRAFETFTGGNVTEKPERLKQIIKNGGIMTDEEFGDVVELVLEHYFNHQAYNGEVVRDRGKAKIDVYNQYLHNQRLAPEDELNLMLMRSSRKQKVGRRGINLKINGGQIDYWDADLINSDLAGQEVYYRYDPEDLSSVRLYNLKDQFLRVVPADNKAVLAYGTSKDKVKEAMQLTRAPKKQAKELLAGLISAGFDQKSVLDLLLTEAQENKITYADVKANPKIISIVRANEEPLLQKAVGSVDLDTMNQNALKKQGGKMDG